ncbi:MAG: MmcQ/YjbR family DNA-binding protein, partial [Bacteroidota bacterium]
MGLESVRIYCLGKQGKITEEFPFDEEVLVFKVF